MNQISAQPTVAVGLLTGVERVRFQLHGDFVADDGRAFAPGAHETSEPLHLKPASETASFTVRDVVIGIGFHWERKQDQQFRGALRIVRDGTGRLTVINDVAVEDYIFSVISSEMSAMAEADLLRAHAVISRSWVLAQLPAWKRPRRPAPSADETIDGVPQRIRWYDGESHTAFDVCADDHCQRYQGITKATSEEVAAAIRETFGFVLTYNGALCDARFSKSCGGMTERFSAAWGATDFDYLQVNYDGADFPAGFALPLSDEANAARWIRASPPAYCQPQGQNVLAKILPDFDQETPDFYRWRVALTQGELQELLQRKLGIDFGRVRSLEPLERGGSGRIVKLRITGERASLVIGKELEIRRALSPSHLYSSAFVVEPQADGFVLSGAGWGHGVGLCQIGAALMAERGFDYKSILAHYYRGATLTRLYAP